MVIAWIRGDPIPKVAPVAGRQHCPTDQELVAAILRGEDRFEVLMRRYNRLVYRLARAILADDAEAEDVAQHAWLVAFENLSRFRGEAQFSTWLGRIAIYEAQRRARLRGRWLPWTDNSAEAIGAAVDRGPSPDVQFATQSLLESLEIAVDHLPENLRTTYMLRDVQGFSTLQSALIMGVSQSAVRVRLHRARQTLRRQLRDSGAFDPSEAFPFAFERCDRLVACVRRGLWFTRST